VTHLAEQNLTRSKKQLCALGLLMHEPHNTDVPLAHAMLSGLNLAELAVVMHFDDCNVLGCSQQLCSIIT
jgi:hypothetical protein